MWWTVSVYCERNAHLTNRKIQVFHRKNTCIRIKHLDRAFIGKVDFRFISNYRMHISRNTEACITYFKTAFTCFCLVFVLSPDCSVNLRQIILKLHGLLIQHLTIPCIFFCLSKGHCRQQKHNDGCSDSTHFSCLLLNSRQKYNCEDTRRWQINYGKMTEKLHLYYREHKCITKQRVRHKLRRLTQIGFDIHPINNQTIWVNRVICGELISRKRKMRSA